AEAGAAVFLRHRRPEQPERPHLFHDCGIEMLLAVVHEHAREQLVLRIAGRCVAHHALLSGELTFEVERILPVERNLFGRGLRPLLDSLCGLRHGRLSAACLTSIAQKSGACRTGARMETLHCLLTRYFDPLIIAKWAPCGSRACTIQAPPGTSCGPISTSPP